MTHTPAPWRVGNDGNGEQEWRINAPNGDPTLNIKSWDSMAVVYGNEDEPDKGNIVGLANATLMASSPNLLEALKTARGYVSDVVTGGLVLANGDKWLLPEMLAEDLAAIDAAIARARGESA